MSGEEENPASRPTAVLWAEFQRHTAEMKAELKEVKAELSKLTQMQPSHHLQVESQSAHSQDESLQSMVKQELDSVHESMLQHVASIKAHMMEVSATQQVQFEHLLSKANSKSAPTVSDTKDESTTARKNQEKSVELPIPEARSGEQASKARKQAGSPVVLDNPEEAQEEEGRSNIHDLVSKSSVHDVEWEMRERMKDESSDVWLKHAFQTVKTQKPLPYRLLSFVGLNRFVLDGPPNNILVDIVSNQVFLLFVAFIILLNTFFMAYIDDQTVKKLLKDPPEDFPLWWQDVDLIFSIFFLFELLIRLAAYRSWFFVAPDMWPWDLLDVFLVIISFVSGGDVNIFFFRMLRLLRLTRMGRLVRVVSWLTELRKLLFQVFYGMVPLFWTMLFIMLTIFFFSLLILRGVAPDLEQNPNNLKYIDFIEENLNGIIPCFTTLSTVVIGDEFLIAHKVMSEVGGIYLFVMPLFVVFVNIGVMNIVIGYFAEVAACHEDGDERAQDERANAEEFVRSMLFLIREFAPDAEDKGELNFEAFQPFFFSKEVQAFLYSHGLDTDSAKLIYELCDRNHDGYLQINELVLGTLKLKGEATSLDAKIILHAINAIEKQVKRLEMGMRGGNGAEESSFV